MIKLDNVSVVFQNKNSAVQAVKDVNIHIQPGEIFGIVGYSGAGKSTLVRTINLLQPPTEGTIWVKGQNMMALTPKELRQARKKIGMIFQHFNLMESRTIFDNVSFPLKGSGLSREEKGRRVAELLDLVGLADKVDSYPTQLSGGQKQRVAIARALANEPDILLCDEATSALDPKTTSSILELLAKLNQQLNLTIVMITHEMSVVKDLCHRVAVMEDGSVLEQGSIVEIFTAPKRPLTREFINTATHFDQEMEIVLKHPSTQALNERGEIISIRYIGDQTLEPFITHLVQEYDLTANILYGHIEILDNTPVGNLLIGLEGNRQQVEHAVQGMTDQGIMVQRYNELLREYVNVEGGDY